MSDFDVDLTTVTHVSVRGTQYAVEKGSFRFGHPTFTMLDENGEPCTYSGSGWHPLSYFFTNENGKKFSGPIDQVTWYVHDTQPPKPKEPEHVLLPVGTRVLVSDWQRDGDNVLRLTNPQPGRISGYDLHKSKYQWQREWEPGLYAERAAWAFVDNRVAVHPDGPQCPPPPKPVTREPTGPRVYVQRRDGRQGWIMEVRESEGTPRQVKVMWLIPGQPVRWIMAKHLELIPEDWVVRCNNGLTGDECGSGENQCELCRQAEDEEGDMIERSMGLR